MVAGEMGRSVFKHPKSYMALFTKYRGTLARGKVGSIVKIGLALHWDKVCGDCFYIPYSPTPQQYNASYTQVCLLVCGNFPLLNSATAQQTSTLYAC